MDVEVGSVTFVRHGQSEANRLNIVQGQLEYPLDDVGIEQSNRLADFWALRQREFDIFITSPLLRARQTSEILAKRLQISFEFDERWMERNYGTAQGKPIRDFLAHTPGGLYPAPFEPLFDSGESGWDLYQRAGQALAGLISRFPARILVVSHGGILNAALRCAIGFGAGIGHSRPTTFRFNNTGFSELEYSLSEGIWWIRSHNCLPHLLDPPGVISQ